jgi:hypothetical protein
MKAQKPKPKRSIQRDTDFAEGGNTKMHRQQAAGPITPARTGKIQNAAPGKRAATGGPRTKGYSLALPAQPGHTAPIHKGR